MRPVAGIPCRTAAPAEVDLSVPEAIAVAGTSSGRPTLSDRIFLCLLAGMLVGVALLGRMTFEEGLKTEHTKAQAEALLAWMKAAAAHRGDTGFEPAPCARRPSSGADAYTWGSCFEALATHGGPLSGVRNTFTGEPIGLAAACTPGDAATVGRLVIDRISTTPPGSAIPTVINALAAGDAIGESLTLRVRICDKGGYPILIGEAEF
jgi:hypothetical protein